MKFSAFLALLVISSFIVNCATTKTTGHAYWTKVFEDIDKDNDGYLSKKEFTRAYPVRGDEYFQQTDSDDDGKISQEEYNFLTGQ